MSSSYEKEIWDGLVALFGNEYGVAALMGNFEAESENYPFRVQGDFSAGLQRSREYTAQVDSGAITESAFVNAGPGGGGYGLAQWTYSSRKKHMYDIHKKLGQSIGSVAVNLRMVKDEMTYYDFREVNTAIRNATSPTSAVEIIMRKYESPGDQSAAAIAKRKKFATAIYNRNHGSAPAPKDEDIILYLSTKPRRKVVIYV